jgi:hypothetical protein
LDGKEPKWCGLWNWHELTFPSWSPEANISNKETLMFWIHPIGFIHASLGWYDLIGGFNSQSKSTGINQSAMETWIYPHQISWQKPSK